MARNDVNGANPEQGGQVPVASYLGQGNVDLDQYPTHFAQLGAGGYRTVRELQDMYDIPQQMRQEGMQCTVQQDGFIYILEANLTTWRQLSTTRGGLPDIITRYFQNEVLITLTNVKRPPVVAVYITQPDGVYRPLIYGVEGASEYGNNEYAQAKLSSFRLWHHEQQVPEFKAEWIPDVAEIQLSFNTPQTGIATFIF